MKLKLLLIAICGFNIVFSQKSKDTLQLINEAGSPVYNAIAYNHHNMFLQNINGGFVFSEFLKDSISVFAPNYQSLKLAKIPSFSLQLEPNKNLITVSDTLKIQLDSAINRALRLSISAKTYSRTTINSSYNIPEFDLRKSGVVDMINNLVNAEINEISLNGFEDVNQKMLSQEILSYQVFNQEIEVFSDKLFSPLGSKRHQAYNFYFVDGNTTFSIIYFLSSSGSAKWEGYILLDQIHQSIAQLLLIKRGNYNAYAKFKFNSEKLWPERQELQLSSGEGGKKLSFFGGGIKFGRIQSKTTKNTKPTNLNFLRLFKDQSLSSQYKTKLAVNTSYNSEEAIFNASTWKDLYSLFLTQPSDSFTSLNTYIEDNKLNQRIRRINALEQGFLPISFLDLDLTRLVKVNNYEGFRLGLGFQTNQQFSEEFRIGVFSAYGTKDTSFKYGFNTGVRLDKSSNTWVNVSYAYDIREVGTSSFLTDQRVYSVFEPRLVNITYFYKYQTVGLNLQHNFSPKVLSEVKFEKSKIDQTRDYLFVTLDDSFTNYTLSTAKFSLRWMPKARNISLNDRSYLVEEGSPSFSAQVEQSFANLFEGDFNFTKFSAKAIMHKNFINGSQSEFILEGNIGIGDLPLTHTFHAFPNSPNKNKIINRFSVAGVKSFETMYFNEFFNTRLATLHMKHRFNHFSISNLIQPQLVLISRHAIGGFDDIQQHQLVEFNTLNKVYNEAGLELNNIIYGFGVSLAYRYGAYHLPVFEDNISFKFTFYLKL